MSARTAHVDTFVRDRLPAPHDQPDFINLDRLGYPERLNCAVELLDRWVERGEGDRVAFIGAGGLSWSYAELQAQVNRIANLLVDEFGLVPGNRVLLRAPNNPIMAAAYLAILKAGGIVVATMPLLRPRELTALIDKAQIGLALCDARLLDDLEKAQANAPALTRIVAFGAPEAELEQRMRGASDHFDAVDTAADDPCLIGFTSGTTGVPKGTIHFHRDMLAICDCYSREVLRPEASDRFIGSPPLAFTFGLGGLVLFPMRVGASTVLLEKLPPDALLDSIEEHRATIVFTAPTAYRAMLSKLDGVDVSSLRKCVSAGEALPKATFEAWHEKTGLMLMDGIGATEMLHIFIAAREEEIRPGATGRPVPGYEAKVIDDAGREVPRGMIGRLAVRGPTGCRYLDDPRQTAYVQNGWNVTGDTYVVDEDGYFWYQARSDDMILSAGYNIAGPEVEAALLAHDAVAECGVVGAPDPERGQIVKAYIVLKDGQVGDAGLVKALQDHVKAELAPYKYPRAIAFVERLPRTETGKLQRFALRRQAAEDAAQRQAS
jgi:2-aminobenzoate-CoA ligase